MAVGTLPLGDRRTRANIADGADVFNPGCAVQGGIEEATGSGQPKTKGGAAGSGNHVGASASVWEAQQGYEEVELPLLIVYGGDDIERDLSRVREPRRHASSNDKTLRIYPGVMRISTLKRRANAATTGQRDLLY